MTRRANIARLVELVGEVLDRVDYMAVACPLSQQHLRDVYDLEEVLLEARRILEQLGSGTGRRDV